MLTMGIDIGTTTISLVLVDIDSGDLKNSKTIAHEAFLPEDVPGGRIQDPERLWQLTLAGMQELVEQNEIPASIGLTGQMHGMLYVDETGNAVSPLYIWQDARGNEVLENGKSSAEILYERTQSAASGYGLITHFYQQKKGNIPENARKMVTISDYIGMKLCALKKPVISRDMAASWGCFDLKTGDFKRTELVQAGVELSYLPEILQEHSVMGTTTGAVPEGIPVMVSLGDNQASVLGSVQEPENTVLVNIGTGSQVSFGTKDYVSCAGNLELRPCSDESFMMVGSGLCGGRAYAMLETFYREIAGNSEAMYEKMEKQAAEFLDTCGKDAAWKVRTTFSGTRSNPKERGSIQGIGIENFHPGAMTAGVLMGIQEELRELYEEMSVLSGKKAQRLVASGNGIRKNKLMQKLTEELYGMKLEIPVCREEAAYGAALYSVVAAGLADSLAEVQKKIKYER